MAKAADKKAPKEEKKVELEVTQEMLDANPGFATEENGIVAGDMIEVSEAEAAALTGTKPAVKPDEKKTAPKGSKGAMAVLKNDSEYVRTYGEDQADELASFLSKSPAYTAVADESIAEVEVPYETKNTDGSINRTSRRFTNKAEAILFRNEHRSTCLVVASKK